MKITLPKRVFSPCPHLHPLLQTHPQNSTEKCIKVRKKYNPEKLDFFHTLSKCALSNE